MTLNERVMALPWFHELELDGVLTPGPVKRDVLEAQADVYFKDGVTGSTVLDVGCWDGFNSFDAHRRGAARVLATDHLVWHDGSGSREAFELARAHLAPSVEVLDIDLSDISPATVGTFDHVLFCGVLYHLRNPLLGLEQAASVCDKTLVVETIIDAANLGRPGMVFYPNAEFADDPSNWWGPNPACVEAMLLTVGFRQVEFTPHPIHKRRGIFHAHR